MNNILPFHNPSWTAKRSATISYFCYYISYQNTSTFWLLSHKFILSIGFLNFTSLVMMRYLKNVIIISFFCWLPNYVQRIGAVNWSHIKIPDLFSVCELHMPINLSQYIYWHMFIFWILWTSSSQKRNPSCHDCILCVIFFADNLAHTHTVILKGIVINIPDIGNKITRLC